jgi:nucleoside-diphosphate-sugar epimerase
MIAVTGANGLLGTYIVRLLHERKQPFVALKRKDSNISHLNDLVDYIIWRDGDITDVDSLHEAFTDVTGIIHTAAFVSFNPRNADKVFKVNVTGTQHVVNAALAAKVKRLLHVSSVAALGRQKDQTEVDETNKWIDNAINSNYAQSKYRAELEVFRGQEEGLSTVIINPSVILGYSNWDKSSSQLFKYAWQEKPFYMDGSFNYIDVRDAASIALQLFDSTIEHDRFILNAGSIGFKDFFDTLARNFNKKGPTIKVGKPFLKPLAAMESLRTRLSGTEPIITRETARLAGTHFHYSAQKIQKTLNFKFQSFDTTVAWCCGRYRELYSGKNH